jgi:hypothetical protein
VLSVTLSWTVISVGIGDGSVNATVPNGQIIAVSEAYNTKACTLSGIESVKTNAPTAEIDFVARRSGGILVVES